ncbi:hypothetical protein BU17DRAFT_102387 [Hysterangium stoloniferum]|nr:hypothetical protein BU17DRAFT_102387 [Hysterangium stoloniferum]
MTSNPADGQTPPPSATNEAGSGTMVFPPDAWPMNTRDNTMFFSPEFPIPPDAPTDESRVPASINEVPLSQLNQELTVEELVVKLQVQISLQQQIACQFKVELDAREKQVSLLSAQLKNAEAGAEKYLKEVGRRQAAMRSLRRKRSKEAGRTGVLDETSNGALEILHAGIGQLKAELDSARVDEKRAHTADQSSHSKDINNLQCTLEAKETELQGLKTEVVAQRDFSEKTNGKLKSLEGEKKGFTKSVQAVDAKLEEPGSQWKAAEAKRAELKDERNEMWLTREELEQERDQLAEDVNFERERAERLTQSLQERGMKLHELEQERQCALDDVARLKELLHARDGDDTQMHQRIMERKHEAEDLRAQMNKMTREHCRLMEDQAGDLHEYARREDAANTELEDALRQKAEANVTLGLMGKQFGLFTTEVERLRRQVHDLQQESADKEIKLLQLHRARAKDKED